MDTPVGSRCQTCGARLAVEARAGRRRLYCSAACKQKAYRDRRTDRSQSAQPKLSGNVARSLDSFVGRDHELLELARLSRLRRVATVTGPPGVGKSRLAAEFAHQVRSRFRDGVWSIDPADLNPAALRQKQALLVLDRPSDITPLLARCPMLRVVHTGREPLGAPGEGVLRIGGLGEDAMRLFTERVRADHGDRRPARPAVHAAGLARALDARPVLGDRRELPVAAPDRASGVAQALAVRRCLRPGRRRSGVRTGRPARAAGARRARRPGSAVAATMLADKAPAQPQGPAATGNGARPALSLVPPPRSSRFPRDPAVAEAVHALTSAELAALRQSVAALPHAALVTFALDDIWPEPVELSRREEDIVLLLASGHTNDQIARRVGVSARMVAYDLTRVRRRLGLESRVEIATWARTHLRYDFPCLVSPDTSTR